MANINTGPQPVPVSSNVTVVPASSIDRAPAPIPAGTPQTPVPPAPVPQSAIDRTPAAVPTPYSTGVTQSRVTASSTTVIEVVTPPGPIVPNLPPPNAITVLEEGSELTGAVRSFNFVGDGVVATANTQTNAVTVLITGGNVTTFYGNANVAAYLASGSDTSNIITTGNVRGSYILGNGSQLTGLAATYANANVAAYLASGSDTSNIITTANITGGNLITSGIVSFTGGSRLRPLGANLDIFAGTGSYVNLITSDESTAMGVDGGGGYVVTAGKTWRFGTSGNLSVAGYINNLTDPVQDQDAATKYYVDTVAQGLNIHAAANLASTADLATYTGATVTYSNGTGGVGATLSLAGNTLTTLDGTAIPNSPSTRLLIKNQANAVLNGVYNYTSSSLLTRSTDMDDTAGLAGGDFLFVTSGVTQADTGWIQTTDNVVVGTSNVVFAQFSSAGTYTANTSAGLVLNGSVFSAQVDNTTTAFNSGNIVVKASAQLTTPNIGAATGTSLSATGNVTGGNIISTGVVVTSTLQAASGNITIQPVYDAFGGTNSVLVRGGNAGFGDGGHVIVQSGAAPGAGGRGGNVNIIASNGQSTNGVVSITTYAGSWTFDNAGNLTVPGSIILPANSLLTGVNASPAPSINGFDTISAVTFSATGNITGGNILGGANVNATTHTGTTVSVTGNITGGNITTAGLVTATGNITATANITGGNITTAGLISATGNITGGNILGGANVNATTHTGTTVSVTGNITGGNITTGGLVTATGNITSTANVTGGNVIATTQVSAGGNVTGGNVTTAGLITATGNITGGNLTTAALTSTASLSVTGNTATVTSANYSIGYLNIPQISLASNVTTALTDSGKHFYSVSASNLSLTIANNTSVTWPVGTAMTIVNRGTANVIVVPGTGVSLYLAGNSTSANRVVTTYGMATVINVAANIWMINGTVT